MPPRRPTTNTRAKASSQPERGRAPEEAEPYAAEEEEYRTSNHYPGDRDADAPYEDEGRYDDGAQLAPEDYAEDPADEEDNPDATRAGPPVTLLIFEGPDRGKKRRFKGVRMVLGRGKGCDLVLEDQSVSRRHLELVYGDTGMLLRDLGSGNGTRVNDELTDERILKHGDVVALGKTRIRYVDELEAIKQRRAEEEAREAEARKAQEEAKKKQEEQAAAGQGPQAGESPAVQNSEAAPNTPQAPAEAPRDGSLRGRIEGLKRLDRKVKLGVGVGGAVLLLLLIGIIIVRLQGPDAPPPPDPRVVLATRQLQLARESMRKEDFAEAVRLIQEAENLSPGIDAEGLGEAAHQELTVVQVLQAVRALMDEDRYEEARGKLAEAPEGTTYGERKRREVEADLDERELAYFTRRADELLQQRDAAGARKFIAMLPASVQPPYRQRLAVLEKDLEREALEAAKQGRANREAAARRAAERRAEFIAEAFEAVQRRFDSGEYQRAVLECDRVVEAHRDDREIRDRARQLKLLIPQFAKFFEDGQRKIRANSLETAVRPVRKADELYRQIGFRGGATRDALNEQLALTSLAAGKAALARNDLASASSHFREARRLNPGDPRLQEGLDALQKKVAKVYLDAVMKRDRDPKEAAEKFQLVIDAADEGSEEKRGAAEALQALQLQEQQTQQQAQQAP